ncbi:hypothetical protein [Flagellimonas pacifica]|uniref:Lipocalin-like domain-containing protein n=1 Tax=Flagellimonas pacifica TaxID=1247520 RepID=A0A285MVT1_9FLAO|nr:hypothetical protein [Allomuricauda parva]SNZ01299.1 hypothetical protein SAMN06265377_3137 [Allomuricauda parva]
MKINHLFFLIIPTLLFLSCKSDDDSVPKSSRDQALLGQWDYEAIVSDRAVDLNGDNISNIDLLGTQEIRQCEKDNITTFTDSGPSNKPEYNVTESNLACDDNGPFSFVEEDFWSLTSNNTVIGFENRSPFRIIELSKNKLIVETDDEFEGLEYVITITYKKR